MNRRTLIIAGIVGFVVIVIALVASFFLRAGPQHISLEEPVDVVLEFYEPWLSAALSTTTNPYTEGLAKAPILSPELRKKLSGAQSRLQTDGDPVLCQMTIPTQIAARPVSESEESAEVLVVSRNKTQPAQAIVTLIREHGGWYMSDIRCSPGEFAPEREFTFDREGHLLKSVPPPLDAKNWHLVFEENNQPGHFAPLFFGAESVCVDFQKKQATCDPSVFVDAMKAHVQGSMTETGVEVRRLELLK